MVVLHFQDKASQLKTESNNLQQQLSTRKVSEQRFHFDKNVSPFMYVLLTSGHFWTCRMRPRNWSKKRMIWNSNYWWSKYVTTKSECACICVVIFDMLFRFRQDLDWHNSTHVVSALFMLHFQANVSELKQQMVDLHQQLLEKQVGDTCVFVFTRVYCRLDKFTWSKLIVLHFCAFYLFVLLIYNLYWDFNFFE